jgi:hypothetical protein
VQGPAPDTVFRSVISSSIALALVTNILLGHPSAPDRLMSCRHVADIAERQNLHLTGIYRNVFGENLTARRTEKTDLIRKLNLFGIGWRAATGSTISSFTAPTTPRFAGRTTA